MQAESAHTAALCQSSALTFDLYMNLASDAHYCAAITPAHPGACICPDQAGAGLQPGQHHHGLPGGCSASAGAQAHGPPPPVLLPAAAPACWQGGACWHAGGINDLSDGSMCGIGMGMNCITAHGIRGFSPLVTLCVSDIQSPARHRFMQ